MRQFGKSPNITGNDLGGKENTAKYDMDHTYYS